MAESEVRKPKNIVVCCDGTGNQFGKQNSNVVKLYTCLAVDRDQRAYYHPGVGTMGDPRKTTWLSKKWSIVKGLAFGAGFQANLADAYKFLMDTYEDGDRIFLFGFSRGAYTVRALAGALNVFGLLCPGNDGHLPYLLSMYSDKSRDAFNREGTRQIEPDDITNGFREAFSRDVIVHFAGVWDTVSSVGWIYDPVKLLYEGQNSIIRKGRHAISVDERRCFFQDNLWGSPLPPEKTPRLTELARDEKGMPEHDVRQDIVQAWFPGVHSDVGGSYKQHQSAPAMKALTWILDEAVKDGLRLNPEKCDAVFGRGSAKYPVLTYWNKPASTGVGLHESLTWKWWPLELFPHKYFDEEGKKHWRLVPWPHRREIPAKALIHPSTRERLTSHPDYRPKNLVVAHIVDYSKAPVALPDPKVMQQLEKDGFGVYVPPPKEGSRPLAGVAVSVAAAAGLALLLWRRR